MGIRRVMMRLGVAALLMFLVTTANGFMITTPQRGAYKSTRFTSSQLRYSTNEWNDQTASDDSNAWKSAPLDNADNWESILEQKKDGSFWSSFELEEETSSSRPIDIDNDDETEAMLDTLAALQAEEVMFNTREAQRADISRRMEEWGFDASTIASTLDVAVEELSDVEGMQMYRETSYPAAADLTRVESHTQVQRDPDTNEPIRSRMVYVDEHACIGCTNCAMIASSTFFMEQENGRARVFEQWGDDEMTVQVAMDSCPVDCIHYVPYQDLVQLEVKRRDQYINVLAGLVSRAERGAGSGLMSSTSRSFGSRVFTQAPTIRGNYVAAGQTEEFETSEDRPLQKAARKRIEEARRRENKVVDF